MRWHGLLEVGLSLHLVVLAGGRHDSLRMGPRGLNGTVEL